MSRSARTSGLPPQFVATGVIVLVVAAAVLIVYSRSGPGPEQQTEAVEVDPFEGMEPEQRPDQQEEVDPFGELSDEEG